MSQEELDDLVAEGALERVAADPETARIELDQARLHAETAAEIADRDPVAAFAIGYDALRKALSAHMRHRGYRVARGPGHHARTGRYAVAAIDDPMLEDHLDAFDELRQMRNQSEYDALILGADDVADALDHADAIINAVDNEI
jgi:hypothetical protein